MWISSNKKYLENLSSKSQYKFSYENNDFVIWAACGLELCK